MNTVVMTEHTTLKRSLSLPLITLYGLGTIVGGGFYALVGEVAARAGMRTPIAFLTAAAIGLVCGLSYGELSARFPVSAGESQYVEAAFHRRWLSRVIGWLVIATGVVSAAVLANAFVRFLQDLAAVPTGQGVVAIVIALGAVAIWGITESVILATVITCIEVGGIVYVVVSGRHHFAELPARLPEMLPSLSLEPWPGILLGSFLAFYAMIGFEDMVNVAEEVREPRRNLPLGILLAIALTTVLYVAASTVAVLALTPEELASSRSPFAAVLGGPGEASSVGVTLIGMLAGLNGALVQIIMASRILYGMAGSGNAPRSLHRVSERTRTPVRATLLATGLVLGFALWLPLVTLAQLTSGIILFVFALVNLALFRIKQRSEPPPPSAPNYPQWVPGLGLALCLGLLLFQLANLLADS